jgi:hypothetical protein
MSWLWGVAGVRRERLLGEEWREGRMNRDLLVVWSGEVSWKRFGFSSRWMNTEILLPSFI